jgi:hypothetical protein
MVMCKGRKQGIVQEGNCDDACVELIVVVEVLVYTHVGVDSYVDVELRYHKHNRLSVLYILSSSHHLLTFFEQAEVAYLVIF